MKHRWRNKSLKEEEEEADGYKAGDAGQVCTSSQVREDHTHTTNQEDRPGLEKMRATAVTAHG